MSLRSDSVYRVDFQSKQEPQRDGHAGSPPKVLQIRLTEQALQQLANACFNVDGSNAGIRIDVDPNDPLLVIGDSEFPLHAPLPAAGSQPTKATTQHSEPGTTSTAPHELYKLSKDESTLHRIGTIATKLTVKPTRDVSAVAQRLKQQKEEEEQRKEERRRALMQGTSPHAPASSSARSGVNKALAGVRASSGSPLLVASPLSRSSSLSRIPTRREPNLLASSSLSRDVSRERASDISTASSTLVKPTGASYEVTGTRRNDRAITGSPQVTGANRSHLRSNGVEEGERHSSDEEQSERKTQLSSPATAASDGASKKATKLTTRQRLAKATKAGSRLLAASERRATPERRTALTATLGSPPSKVGAPSKSSLSASSSTDETVPGHAQSPPKVRKTETSAYASPRREAGPSSNRVSQDAAHDVVGMERGRKVSTPSTSTASDTRDKALVSPGRSSTASGSRKPGGESITVQVRPEKELAAVAAADRRSKVVDGKGQMDRDEAKAGSKPATSTAVQVVTVKKAKPSTGNDAGARPLKRTQVEPSEQDRSARASISSREQRDTETSKSTSARQTPDDHSDSIPRKRRRTDEFASSDSAPRTRDRRPSLSSNTSNLRTDDARRREPSREGVAGRNEPASPPARVGPARGNIPVSASMPSFASASDRLQTVAEDHESKRHRVEYHDRRRDRSYDDDSRYDDPSAATHRDRISHREREEVRKGREADDVRIARDDASAANRASAASSERPIKGVGPGATHWSEPWLDVRSKSDWHRLAQRFTKTQEDYLSARRRLEVESERLESELQLAIKEEQAQSQRLDVGTAPAEHSLLFSPHTTTDAAAADVEMETAINTSLNARRQSKVRKVEEGDESPEEGEMRSSDDDERGEARGSVGSSTDSILFGGGGVRRSESPDCLAWRAGAVGRAGSSQAGDRPLSYADLQERLKQLEELHGSLGRMHRVLVEFKGKERGEAGRCQVIPARRD